MFIVSAKGKLLGFTVSEWERFLVSLAKFLTALSGTIITLIMALK